MYDARGWRGRRVIGVTFLALFAVFVGAMIVFMLLVGARVMPYGYYPMYPFGWFWGLLGFFFLLGLLRWAVWGPRWWGYYRGYGHGVGGREHEAYHILRTRYARGEISKEQLDTMMRDLYPPPRQGP